MNFVTVPVEPHEIAEITGGLTSIYREAFTRPPHDEGETEVAAFPDKVMDHAGRRGFRLLVAHSGDTVVGFAYGFRSEAGGWTQNFVKPLLTDEEFGFWFSDCFEVVELAVSTGAQGRGLGGRLHDDLLDGVSNRTAILFVNVKGEVARSLYRGRGWRVLAEDIALSEREVRSNLMGLEVVSREVS